MGISNEVQRKRKLIAYIKSKTESDEIAAKEKKSRATANKSGMASIGKGIMGIAE